MFAVRHPNTARPQRHGRRLSDTFNLLAAQNSDHDQNKPGLTGVGLLRLDGSARGGIFVCFQQDAKADSSPRVPCKHGNIQGWAQCVEASLKTAATLQPSEW